MDGCRVPLVGVVVDYQGRSMVIYQRACTPPGAPALCDDVTAWSATPQQAAERFTAGWVTRLAGMFPPETVA